MSRFTIQWSAAWGQWQVLDVRGRHVAWFGSLHEAEQYVIERSTRSEA